MVAFDENGCTELKCKPPSSNKPNVAVATKSPIILAFMGKGYCLSLGTLNYVSHLVPFLFTCRLTPGGVQTQSNCHG